MMTFYLINKKLPQQNMSLSTNSKPAYNAFICTHYNNNIKYTQYPTANTLYIYACDCIGTAAILQGCICHITILVGAKRIPFLDGKVRCLPNFLIQNTLQDISSLIASFTPTV